MTIRPISVRPISLRKLLLAACATSMLAPLPALAHDVDARSDISLGELRAKLADPRSQVAATTMLAALSEAVLDTRVDKFVRAMRTVDPRAGEDLPRDARLRDLAGPGAEHLSGDIGRNVPRAMGRAADMAGAMEDMLPELRAMGDRARERLRVAIPDNDDR